MSIKYEYTMLYQNEKVINVFQFLDNLSNEMFNSFFYYKFIQLIQRIQKHQWVA